MKKVLLIISLTLVLTNASKADSYSGTSYNWSTGEYNYEWHDIDSNNGSGSFETYNWQTGEFNTVDLD